MPVPSFTLVIGNKNYSSWSMRPWVLLRQFGIPFTEVMLKFHSAEWDAHINRLSPSRLVPVLWDGEPGDPAAIGIWDTLAIAEYIAERIPKNQSGRAMRGRAPVPAPSAPKCTPAFAVCAARCR